MITFFPTYAQWIETTGVWRVNIHGMVTRPLPVASHRRTVAYAVVKRLLKLDEDQLRSPIYKINQLKKPVLLFHGKKDLVISYKKTLQIKEKLLKNNKNSEVIIFENEGHGFKNTNNKKQVLVKTQEFLEKTLNI